MVWEEWRDPIIGLDVIWDNISDETLADPELQFRGGHMASAEREPMSGAPSGVQGQSPWSGG